MSILESLESANLARLSEEEQEALLSYQDWKVTEKVRYKGTMYNADGSTGILAHSDEKKNDFNFCLITKIIIFKEKVAFLVKKMEKSLIVELGLYQVFDVTDSKPFVVKIEDLANFVPVNIYTMKIRNNESKFSSLRHLPIMF